MAFEIIKDGLEDFRGRATLMLDRETDREVIVSSVSWPQFGINETMVFKAKNGNCSWDEVYSQKPQNHEAVIEGLMKNTIDLYWEEE